MPKTIAIHQPNFLPYPGYFAKMIQCDMWIWLDSVQYTSGGASAVTNRNKIKTSVGEKYITVPVQKCESNIIKDIKIDYNQNWSDKMSKTISLEYRKTPFFDEVFSIIDTDIKSKFTYLADLNISLVDKICNFLQIDTPKVKSSEMNIDDTCQKDDLLIEIIKKNKGDVYLSGRGGLKYMEMEKYTSQQIEVNINNYHPIEYNQKDLPFIQNLSILDLLFYKGKESKVLLLNSI